MTLYLSHIRLARNPSALALASLLMPADAGRRRSAHHSLLWTVFSDGPDRRRDFLWRAKSDGSFLTLSARAPQPMDLFEPHQIKAFDPQLSVGDQLDISLRANATRMKRGGERVDIVMDALHAKPQGERAAVRMHVAQREGKSWLQRQGDISGFRVVEATVEDYSTETLPQDTSRRTGNLRFGILDITGRIEVTDTQDFLAHLSRGFGRAKAFGCGLMLIRRAG